MRNENSELIIKAGVNEFKITTFKELADTLFINLVSDTTSYIKKNCTCESSTKEGVGCVPPEKEMALPQEVLNEALNNVKKEVEEEKLPSKNKEENVQAVDNKKGFNLNDRKIRLAIMKCEDCGTTSALLVDDYNKPYVCKYCSHETSFEGTRKGRYECKCGK